MTKEEIDTLLQEYIELKTIQYQLAQKENEILTSLSSQDPKPDDEKGKYTIQGLTLTAKIGKRVSVSYPKGSAVESPLVTLMRSEVFSTLLEKMFRVKYEESGQKVQEFLSKDYDRNSVQACVKEKLLQMRVTSPGKISVEVKRVE